MTIKKTRYNNVQALRKIFGQTQAEFAATIGVSKDAVVSWENGRNPLSAGFARRISHATGVDVESLQGTGELLVYLAQPKRDFTLAEYKLHRKKYWENSNQNSALRLLGPCKDALELIFRAAAKAGEEAETLPLPAVLDTFVQWCRQTEKDFQLIRQIDAQLAERKGELTITRSYGQWRAEAKSNPDMTRKFGFKDNPKRDDQEPLTLSMETTPVWAPGWDMRGGKQESLEIKPENPVAE